MRAAGMMYMFCHQIPQHMLGVEDLTYLSLNKKKKEIKKVYTI